MGAFFEIGRIVEAIEHLQPFDSKWVIVPLVFGVNGVGTGIETNVNASDKAGTDRFLDQYFHGSLIGLPPLKNGRNTMRPRFAEIYDGSSDFVIRTGQKLWANAYSSRGYREMRAEGIASGEYGKWTLAPTFWQRWEAELPETFHFEELLVWLYAFRELPDGSDSWHDLLRDFCLRHLGPGNDLKQEYKTRFHVENGVSWPRDLLEDRPHDAEYQARLLPSGFGITIPTPASVDLGEAVSEFAEAVQIAGVSFGERHESVIRTFISSAVTKPFLILTGLSGSGKTQIAMKFGEWLGKNNWTLVPVRPDWVGPESVFGYEDALDANANRAWFVPDVLQFLLRASRAPEQLHLLVLDEMNLAHVERYFADFLSGMEAGTPVLPNLIRTSDGRWRHDEAGDPLLPFPTNVVVVGTVNVDETTYMFSPKVLDRANTLEFRVSTQDLDEGSHQPDACQPGSADSIKSLLIVAQDRDWHRAHAASYEKEFVDHFIRMHGLLSREGFEFGHRVFLEAVRFCSVFAAAGGATFKEALDLQVMQKLLPRLNGSLKRLGPTILAMGRYCFDLSDEDTAGFDLLAKDPTVALLPVSFSKMQRMYRNLLAYQFVSFTDQ